MKTDGGHEIDEFQSTLPIQGETKGQYVCLILLQLFQSTLPIQGETFRISSCLQGSHFNPLSLYRERQQPLIFSHNPEKFQSTLPIQGETFLRMLTTS